MAFRSFSMKETDVKYMPKVGDRVQIKVNDAYSYYVVIRRIENTSESENDTIRGF